MPSIYDIKPAIKCFLHATVAFLVHKLLRRALYLVVMTNALYSQRDGNRIMQSLSQHFD